MIDLPAPDPALTALIARLNPAQREAVTAPPVHRLVLAGAGSGKTRVLTHRIAWLIAAENVSPYSILAVTFTNKAAAAMRSRIEQLITVPVRAMWVGTFHGIAHRMLRMHWKEAHLPQNFQIIDADDQQRLVKRVLRGLDLPDDQWPPRSVCAFINARKEEGLRPEALQDQGDFSQRQLVRVYTAYENVCRAAGLVDFAELLLRAHELTRDNADIQAHYRHRFRHILVDEFQDTNALQYAWLRVLAGDTGTLFAVGDDDQCLAAGTPVTLADGTLKPIETVTDGDAVRSVHGSGPFRAATVLRRKAVRRRSDLVELRTRGGRRLVSTPEHTHFAGYLPGETPQLHFTCLMVKAGVGYRLGTSQVCTRGQARPMLGFKQRCLHEHADAVWVISTHDSENAARAEEMLLSLRYGLPTLPFVARRGRSRNGLVHDPQWIARVFSALDTLAAAQRLLADVGLRADAPHHRPQPRDANRRNLVVTLCGDRRGAQPMHRISIAGNDAAGRAALVDLGLSVRPAKSESRSWRFETCRKDFGELMVIAERIRRHLGAELLLQANLNGRSLPFTPAGSIRPGMAMVDAEGDIDIVESVDRVDGSLWVYDLDIEFTHNFVAAGLVTHNSVYSWRGARVEHMMRIQKDFPGAEVVRLEQNYRSTGTILKAANGLIAKNTGRLGKNLWTQDDSGEAIRLYAAFNEMDEAEFVCARVAEHLATGGRHDDLAVLYRSNAQSRVLEEALIRHRLPYRIHGGLRFFERMEVKDALAYLRLLASRDDDPGFERAVNTPPRGIGATTLERLRSLAREQGLSLWKTARAALVAPGAPLGRSAGKVQGFLDLIDTLGADTRDDTLSQRMEAAIDRSGLRAHFAKEKSEQAEGRLENLDELVNACRSFELDAEARDNPPPTEGEAETAPPDPLSEFLTHAALEAGERQAGAGEDGVQLMTMHAAKGLEFPVVFLVGMEQGLFPNQRATDEGNLEEERRLCYVGLTRARQRLYLSYAEVRRVYGTVQAGMPSMFLREIPAECVVETRPRSGVLRPMQAAPANRPTLSRRAVIADEVPGGYRLGQSVRHAKFGEGTILSFEGSGERTQVEVRFRGAGTKRLLLSMAKLQKA